MFFWPSGLVQSARARAERAALIAPADLLWKGGFCVQVAGGQSFWFPGPAQKIEWKMVARLWNIESWHRQNQRMANARPPRWKKFSRAGASSQSGWTNWKPSAAPWNRRTSHCEPSWKRRSNTGKNHTANWSI